MKYFIQIANLEDLKILHADFPEKIRVVIEQPNSIENRIEYNSQENYFYISQKKSWYYKRGFKGGYGWVTGLGTPPQNHLDAILLTKKSYRIGEIIDSCVCGIYYKSNNDNKIIAYDETFDNLRCGMDLFSLPIKILSNLFDIYPNQMIYNDRGWFGKDEAIKFLIQLNINYINNKDNL